MRAFFCVLWEAMIAELRAVQNDLHVRATFTKDGDTVTETRSIVAEHLPRPGPTEEQREVTLLRSASRLSRAFEDGFVEVG